jgi:WD40 repeat protein
VFTHDSKKVFSATLKGLILSWDVGTGAFLGTLQGHTERVDFLHTIPGKDILISCDTKGGLLVWDTTNGSKIFVTSITGSGFGSVGVSEKYLIVPTSDNKIDFISLDQFSSKYTLELTHFPLTSLQLSQDCRYLAVSSKNNTYTVYSMPENSTVEKMYAGPGKALCFSEDGKYLFTLNGQSLSIIDSINNTIESTINFQGLDFHSMKTNFNLAARTQSRLGHGLCLSGEDIKMQMREKNLCTPHKNNQHLFIQDRAESVSLWNIRQNTMVTRFTCESDIRVVTFIHDRETLIIGDEMGNVHFLQLQNIV